MSAASPGLDDFDAAAQEQLRELAGTLAREAGELLLKRFQEGRGEGVRSKTTPTDLVSEADLAAERLVKTRLSELRPDDAFLGEEGGGSAGSSGLRWVVDPLDGTINFLFGIPQWSVSVAVQRVSGSTADEVQLAGTLPPAGDGLGLGGGVTLAGAVFDPSREELWSASLAGEATLNGAPLERPQQQRPDLGTAMLATGLAYDASVRAIQAEVLARLIPKVRDIRRLGSAALDLVWTAAGRYDAYFERTVKLWDIAAGVLICQRALLAVRELPDADSLPWGVLACRPELADLLYPLVA